MFLKKLDKNIWISIAFIAVLIVATVIIMNLSVGWFTVLMPIIAGAIFLGIFLLPDEKDDSK